jgi:ketosteroid isomerase-like protein
MNTNEELARTCFEGLVHCDTRMLAGVLASDVTWHHPGTSPLAGTHKGLRDVLRHLAQVRSRTGDTLRLGLHDITASDRHAVIQLTVEAWRRGLRLDEKVLLVLALGDGRIAEVRTHVRDQYFHDRFFS